MTIDPAATAPEDLPVELRRRHRDAHARAAEAHEHAANVHEETAAFMDEHGQPEKAAFHRDAADRNRQRAHEESMKAAEYDI
jgi:hypothetical protein